MIHLLSRTVKQGASVIFLAFSTPNHYGRTYKNFRKKSYEAFVQKSDSMVFAYKIVLTFCEKKLFLGLEETFEIQG
jgi:hypothetical protein